MRILYTTHARKRMLDRSIVQSDVESVLSHPDKIEEARNGTLMASRRIGGKVRRIIYSQKGNDIIVITVC